MLQSAKSIVAAVNVNRMGGYDIRQNTYLGKYFYKNYI